MYDFARRSLFRKTNVTIAQSDYASSVFQLAFIKVCKVIREREAKKKLMNFFL